MSPPAARQGCHARDFPSGSSSCPGRVSSSFSNMGTQDLQTPYTIRQHCSEYSVFSVLGSHHCSVAVAGVVACALTALGPAGLNLPTPRNWPGVHLVSTDYVIQVGDTLHHIDGPHVETRSQSIEARLEVAIKNRCNLSWILPLWIRVIASSKPSSCAAMRPGRPRAP